MGTWVEFDAVKKAVPILSVLGHYGLVKDLRKQGSELHGRCPIHRGKGEESFRVNSTKNVFHCFSCQAKGNVLDFVMAMEKCDIRAAALMLQDWFGLPASKGTGATAPAPVTGSKLAREKRGEDENPSTVESAKDEAKGPNKPLGFELRGIDHDYLYLDKRGISKTTAQHFGVGLFLGKGSMSGRVVIPIHNERGELLAYAGRSIDGAEPKYKLPAGFRKSQELYNLHRVISGTGTTEYPYRGLVVVEGFFDCMKVHQAGYPYVVALMGCTMSEEQERLLSSHADRVWLMLDGDEAGRKGAQEIAWRLGRHVWTRVIELGEGEQPDQMTTDELRALLK